MEDNIELDQTPNDSKVSIETPEDKVSKPF